MSLTTKRAVLAAILVSPAFAHAQSAAPNTATINGALLGQQVQQRDATGGQSSAAFRQALRGFPRDALTIKVGSIAPLPNAPNEINVQYKLGISQDWVERLKASLSALAIDKYQSAYRAPPLSNPADNRFNDILMSGRGSNEWGARFCIYGNGQADCYLLPPGDFSLPLLPPTGAGNSTPAPLVALRLFAADAAPTSACLVRDLGHHPNVIDYTIPRLTVRTGGMQTLHSGRGYQYSVGKYYNLYTDEANGALILKTAEANLSKSVKMEFRPAFGVRRDPQQAFLMNGALGQPNGFATADLTELPTERDVCGLR